MALPTIEDLTDAFAAYVNTPAANNTFVRSSVEKAVAYILNKLPSSPDTVDGYITADGSQVMPEPTYEEEVMELAGDLFYRRQAQNSVVSVNAMDGLAIRVARDPYAACDQRLQRWIGLGFA